MPSAPGEYETGWQLTNHSTENASTKVLLIIFHPILHV